MANDTLDHSSLQRDIVTVLCELCVCRKNKWSLNGIIRLLFALTFNNVQDET